MSRALDSLLTLDQRVDALAGDVAMGNSGWAWTRDLEAARVLQGQGYTLIQSAHALWSADMGVRVYSAKAQAALRTEAAAGNTTVAESTYKPPRRYLNDQGEYDYDYEAAILARQEREGGF